MAKTFVIGDIHGCHQALTALWKKIAPVTSDDTVVFLGDYIDRGPDSRQVVEAVLAIRQGWPRVITLMGNHELMLLDFLAGRETPFLEVGGSQTLASYGIAPDSSEPPTLPPSHLNFFRDLLPFWQNQEGIYVHAGLAPGRPLAIQPRSWLFWAREEFLASEYNFGKPVIYGHTPFPSPRLDSYRIGIDTGAVYGGQLTCLVLPDREFVQVAGTACWR